MTRAPLLRLAGTVVLAVVVLAGVMPSGVHAQNYPTKAIRILTGYPPGGPSDILGRVLSEHFAAVFGQPSYVEGKPGAAGNLAGEILANAPPDGHTLYIAGLGNVAVNRDLYGNMSYDPATAYAPISLLARFPIVLEVKAKLPVADYPGFIAYAKTHRLNHGSPGIGTLPHLAAELFKVKVGFDSTHIAYRGTGPFSNAMTQGELEWSFDVPNAALALSQGNFVRLLAVSSAQRHALFPGLPTLVELGLTDFVADTWFGLVAPAGTPAPIIDRLAAETARAVQNPEMAARMRSAGLDPAPTTPAETARIFAADRARWGAVVRDNHIKAE
ncbi:MAG: tripartite tricarboxylate transporter substrate binding protein [Proteobacteria bacterium]|nr:tripartite tricarboxylate transporter substrate binding protein [Pseudomonadota bacterium]